MRESGFLPPPREPNVDETQNPNNTMLEPTTDVNENTPNKNPEQLNENVAESSQKPIDDAPILQSQTQLNEEEEEAGCICSICMEELHDPVSTPCGHVFCRRCIEEWLLRSDVCPYCNTPKMDKNSLLPILDQGHVEDRPDPDNSLKNNRWYHKMFRLKLTLSNIKFPLALLIFLIILFVD